MSIQAHDRGAREGYRNLGGQISFAALKISMGVVSKLVAELQAPSFEVVGQLFLGESFGGTK